MASFVSGSLYLRGLRVVSGHGNLLSRILRPVHYLFLFPVYGYGGNVAAKVRDKTVVITGCDSGFGHMLAVALDRMGVPVIAACLTSQGCDELSVKCSKTLKAIVCDVTKDDHVAKLKKFVEENVQGRLWGLVNNAGIYNEGPLDMITVKEFQATLDVNFFGAVRVTLALLPMLRNSAGSRVVYMSSMAGFISSPTMTAYCCSKHAVEALGDAMRKLLWVEGVHVSIIEPGFMRTGIVTGIRATLQKKYDAAPLEVRQAYGPDWPSEVERYVTELYTCSQDPTVVVDDLMHALWSRWPWSRYHSGWDSKLCSAWASAVPTCLQDTLQLLVMGCGGFWTKKKQQLLH